MLWRYSHHMLHSYGELHLLRGEFDRARERAEECIAMATASESKKNLAKGRRLLGQALSASGDHAAGQLAVQTAIDIATEIGNPTQLWKSRAALGDIRTASGDEAGAKQAYAAASEVIDGVASGLSNVGLREAFLGSQAVTAIRRKATAT
jgi:hypothetical protein